MSKKIIFIICSIVIMIFGITYMGIKKYQSSMKTFSKSGYIIDVNKTTEGNNKSTVYYFNNETKYKNRYDEKVIFDDVNGQKVGVSQASFIHYDDESIGVLKKSVILNLNEIEEQIPKYYNIFSNAILQKNKDSYNIDNLGKTLTFKKFIIKVNNEKYLIVSPTITAYLDGTTETKINSNYIELSFIDEKVVNIETKDVKYQTIGKEAYIDLGNDMKLSLDNRYIFIKDEAKISIDQMIIDSSDNIEIQPIEEKTEEENKDGNEEENNEDNNGNNGYNQGQDGESGQEGNDSIASSGEVETEVVESELSLPTADLGDLEIAANKIEGTIKIIDNDSLIVGGSTTKIIENSTGKIVELIEGEEGKYNIEVSSNRLLPDTIYNLTTTISYKKNDITYTMDIVQNVFQTSSLGISLEKDYVTSDKISYNLIFDEYTKVKSCNVVLKDTNGGTIETIFVEKNLDSTTSNILFSGLTSNTKYSIIVDNILYNDYIASSEYAIEESVKTLKEKPNLGTPNYQINRKENKFILQLEGTSDKGNGIESYKYQVFDKRLMNSGNGNPIKVIEKQNLSTIDLPIDSNIIYRGVAYVYNVIIEFYDNEKYIEYVTTYSEMMQIDGKEAPSLKWTPTTVTHEKIYGTISINDPSMAIDQTKDLMVVYSNSVGTVLQYPTGYAQNITFNKNNLRANDTYTISIYGTVNFDDGNPTLENYHIGSVAVKTLKTNAFNTSMTSDKNNVLDKFTINAQLLENPLASNMIEAKTLNGITFVLHEGSSTSGKVIKEIQKLDLNENEYESDLKRDLYDKPFIINPEFFNIRNVDLNAEYYTIEIKDAYDYTDFKNDIPINNNSITVRANDGLPSQINVNDAVTYSFIRNKDATEVNPDLEADTIVGLVYKAAYDNAKRNAKSITYRVFEDTNCNIDERNCKEITSAKREFDIGEDGVLNEVYMPVLSGTEPDTEDNEIRRGHSYYITIEISLDLNGDGVADTTVPLNNTIYKSTPIIIPKQGPVIKMYPSVSTSNSIKIKYKYKDPDYTMTDKTLYATIKKNDIETLTDTKTIELTSTYKEATFGGLSNGVLKIYSTDNYFKPGTNNMGDYEVDQIHQYISHVFTKEYTLPTLKYRLESRTNRMIIRLSDYMTKIKDYDKIATYNVKITGLINNEETTKEIKYNELKDDTIEISLFDIAEFKNQSIKVDVEVLYDTEIFGYEIPSTTYYALQNSQGEDDDKEYIFIKNDNFINYSNLVAKSVFTLGSTSDKFIFDNVINRKLVEIEKEGDEGGLIYNYNHILPKKLQSTKLTPESDAHQYYTFDTITPGISVLSDKGESRITPMIKSVNVGAKLFGLESGIFEIQDSKVYIEVYSTNDDGTDLQLVKTVEKTAEQLDSTIDIDGLVPDSPYAIQFYAYVKNGNTYEKRRLYDVDNSDEAMNYYFRTLSGVTFSNFTHTYEAESYNEKYLKFTYSMDKTLGFDKVKYIFRKKNVNPETGEVSYENMGSNIASPSTVLQRNMMFYVDVKPSSNPFDFGGNYQVEAIPITTAEIDGVIKQIELTNDGGIYDFKITKLRKPYVGMKSELSELDVQTNTRDLTVSVNVYDTNKVIVDGEYSISLRDSEDNVITPTEYRGVKYPITERNKKFTFSNLPTGRTYKVVVYYETNMENKSEEEFIVSTGTQKEFKLLGADEINVGNISINRNSDNAMELIFTNSNYLTEADKLVYSIYNTSDGTSISKVIDFHPIGRTIGDDEIFVQEIPDRINEYGLYYIQLQIYKGDIAVYDGGLEYAFISSS